MNFTACSWSYLQIVLCIPRVFRRQESCKLDVGIRLDDFLQRGYALETYTSINEYTSKPQHNGSVLR
jgi:hypothetical protein